MKITINTQTEDREAYFNELTKLAKSMGFYGPHTPYTSAKSSQKALDKAPEKASEKHAAPTAELGPLSVDQILRLEIMMGNLEGVICALSLGADINHTVKGVSIRALAQAYKNEKIIRAIEDFEISKPKPSTRKKPKPYQSHS